MNDNILEILELTQRGNNGLFVFIRTFNKEMV